MIRKKPKYFYTKSIFAKMLIPLSMFYILVFAIVKFKISKPKKICKKTICVGNIVLGGSGKTPVCIALCEALKNRNCDVCFISKGYGRHLRSNFIIPHNHNALFNYKEVGDESLIKIHFHTDEPWKVLEYCSTIGDIYDIVVEDMERQSNGLHG